MALCASNVTSGFVDLATYDELEKYMYGGADATAYFVRETRKSTWFTQVPVCLTRSSGDAQFGQEWSAQISRSGDYLLNTWLQVTFPSVRAVSSTDGTQTNSNIPQLRWCHNLMHNLVEEASITFNDLVAARFDSYHMDFWSQFAVPESKYAGYKAMIGANHKGCQPITSNVNTGSGADVLCGQHELLPGSFNMEDGHAMYNNQSDALPEATLFLPLPFFFTRDSGVALPTAALPYNEMRINLKFRNWDQLLLVSDLNATNATVKPASATMSVTHGAAANYALQPSAPKLTNVHVWGNYAIVSNDERKRMACAPRDILIEQVQTAPRQSYEPATNPSPSYNLRFSHAIKALFFAVRNKTCPTEWSYYTVAQPLGGHGVAEGGAAFDLGNHSQFPDFHNSNYLAQAGQNVRQSIKHNNPVDNVSLVYENTARLQNMGSGYHSLVQPHYHAPKNAAAEPGYHMYSYSLDFMSLDPLGSTNYGKLTNVSLTPTASAAAKTANGTQSAGLNALHTGQKYEFVCTAVNNNIVRISGGALGFPVL